MALLAYWAAFLLAHQQLQRVGAGTASPTGGTGDLLHQHLSDSTEFDWSRPANGEQCALQRGSVEKGNPSAAPTGESPTARAGRCPSWVTNYTAFHRTMRGTQEAKYLVHTCHSVRPSALSVAQAVWNCWAC